MSDLPPLGSAEWLRARRLDGWLVEICPARFAEATLDSLPAVIAKSLTAWADGGPTENLILRGPVGTGKTHAAFAVLRHLYVEGDQSVGWYPLSRMLRQLRPDGGLTIEEVIAPQVLLIDDVGTEKRSEWTIESLDAILDERYLERRATIVSTNYDQARLRAAIGERAYSRLGEGAAAVVTVNGPDRRRPLTGTGT